MTTGGDRDPREQARPGLVALEGQLTGTQHYRLRPSTEVFPTLDGDVYLLRPGGGPELVIRQPEPVDRELLARLETGTVRASPSSAVARRLQPLIDAGAVLTAPASERLAPEDAERFARQLPYLAEAGDPAEVQRRLRTARIVVLGCGGLGTWAIGALACLGVGRLVLVDDDAIELSNLNRQVLYRADDVGSAKAGRAADWVRGFDPAIEVQALRRRVRGPDDLGAVLDGADLLVQAADWPPYELGRWVNAACVAARVPWMSAGQQPPVLKVGPIYAPGRGPCFACHERALRRDFPRYDELVGHRRRHPTAATTLGPASGMVGSLVAMEVLHLLMGGPPPATLGRALLVDMRTLDTRWEAVARDPACPVCGQLFPA